MEVFDVGHSAEGECPTVAQVPHCADGREPGVGGLGIFVRMATPDDTRNLIRVLIAAAFPLAATSPGEADAERLTPLAREAARSALSLWRPSEADVEAVIALAGPRVSRSVGTRIVDGVATAEFAPPSLGVRPARRAVASALAQIGESPTVAPRALVALAALVALEDLEALYEEWTPVRRDDARREMAESLRGVLDDVPLTRSRAAVTFARSALDGRWVVVDADVKQARAAELEAVTLLRAATDELGELRSTLFVLPAPDLEVVIVSRGEANAHVIQVPAALHGAALALAKGAASERNAAHRLRARLRPLGCKLADLVVVDAR
ncbi:MAG: hypothetical protein KIT58_13775 [Planctomycetota bacterium]|nr:hypothetical protein [Planctomycetota bacterium]